MRLWPTARSEIPDEFRAAGARPAGRSAASVWSWPSRIAFWDPSGRIRLRREGDPGLDRTPLRKRDGSEKAGSTVFGFRIPVASRRSLVALLALSVWTLLPAGKLPLNYYICGILAMLAVLFSGGRFGAVLSRENRGREIRKTVSEEYLNAMVLLSVSSAGGFCLWVLSAGDCEDSAFRLWLWLAVWSLALAQADILLPLCGWMGKRRGPYLLGAGCFLSGPALAALFEVGKYLAATRSSGILSGNRALLWLLMPGAALLGFAVSWGLSCRIAEQKREEGQGLPLWEEKI